MTTEAKKPSEWILRVTPVGGGVVRYDIDSEKLVAYLDAEHERRQAFEAGVLQALQALGLPLAEQADLVARIRKGARLTAHRFKL